MDLGLFVPDFTRFDAYSLTHLLSFPGSWWMQAREWLHCVGDMKIKIHIWIWDRCNVRVRIDNVLKRMMGVR